MLVWIHGVAGGWDELAIAVVGLAVLWVAVKLAGRRSGPDIEDDEAAPEELVNTAEEERQDPGRASSTKSG